MAKRFTATEKWADPWFCSLKPIEKLFFFYLIENCDHAGIWQVNWPLVKFHLGTTVFDLSKFEGRIIQLSDSKWFMKKFIDFQYNGTLNPENRTHASVISILEKEGAYKGLTSPLQGCKDKGTDKGNTNTSNTTIDKDNIKWDFDALWAKYPRKIGKHDAQRHFTAQVKSIEDHQNIIKALENFLKSDVVKGEAKFIPHGSTWFNNRWRDYLDIQVATGKSQAMIDIERMIEDDRKRRVSGIPRDGA